MSILASDIRPTAIICGNDLLALGVLSADQVLSMGAPEELSVFGCDDILTSSWPHVGLTTARRDLVALAAGAVDLLLMGIDDPGQHPIIRRFPVSLVRRRTHGPACWSLSGVSHPHGWGSMARPLS